ncbi:MAG: hypothetical protein IPM77_14430 [Crocinitomicaceae bacterium]|nr:hypothetical protein [Crocinitomicaceae bacterium]
MVCDTIIMQSGAYLDCIILEIDNENITYTDCPPSDHKFKIPVTKIKHYNKQERPEVIDSESETERVTDPESLNEEYELRKAKGIKLFLISLIFLFTFGLGILCAIFLFEIAGAVIIIGSLIIGYPVLANAAKNLKIAQLLKPEEFIKSKIDGLFVLIILGMMLFGSIPFLIPFFIAWLIILKLAKKEVNLIK